MQKYITLLLMLFFTNSFAENITTLNYKIQCSDEKTVKEVLTNFNEKQVIFARNVTEESYSFPVALFANRETGTWTLIQKINDLYCVIGAGTNFTSTEVNQKSRI